MQLVDVLPTVLDLMEVPTPVEVTGRSLRADLEGLSRSDLDELRRAAP